MKLIIDISKETYEQVKMCITGTNNIVEIRSAIRQSTPLPDNATNGDMIKALFPNFEFSESRMGIIVYQKDIGTMEFEISWWNAPYKKGE